MIDPFSQKARTLIAIPARLKATRLPDKPLADICGVPMIVHVWRRAIAADIGRVVVATDSDAIANAVRDAGGEAVMTRDDHPSGSDRIHEVVAALDPDGALDMVINLQGDLPTLDPGLIRAVALVLADGPADITTLAAPITEEDERHNPNVVKVIGSPITDRLMRALYFTRATAPHGDGPLYHHIGIYAYTRAALARFVALPPSPLERRERLEQLRALEAGMRVDVAIVDTVPLGVDTPADLARARTVIASDRTGTLGAPMRTPLATASLIEPLAAGAAQRVVYQGEPGANSHLACQHHFPDLESVATETFEDCFAAVKSGAARYAMIPIENSVAGRVADIHHLLPESGLYITAEHFERVRHQLLGLPGATLADLKTVHSHTMALGQCRKVIRALGLRAVPEADTAGAARMIKEDGDKRQAAIASKLAADVHGLEILQADIEDATHNTTRFIILSSEPDDAEPEDGPVITTFVFKVRNVPAALYKALGGFATNGVNMTKLESYQLEGTFEATMFYADIQGHPLDRSVRLALEELSFFSNEVRIFGTYRASPQRAILSAASPAMASHGK